MLEYLALAIGARSQSARTYLERHLSEFADCDGEGLIQHGLKALRETLQQDKDLTLDNTSIVSVLQLPGRVWCQARLTGHHLAYDSAKPPS
jgi:20S proteasome subunit alpha 6